MYIGRCVYRDEYIYTTIVSSRDNLRTRRQISEKYTESN